VRPPVCQQVLMIKLALHLEGLGHRRGRGKHEAGINPDQASQHFSQVTVSPPDGIDILKATGAERAKRIHTGNAGRHENAYKPANEPVRPV